MLDVTLDQNHYLTHYLKVGAFQADGPSDLRRETKRVIASVSGLLGI